MVSPLLSAIAACCVRARVFVRLLIWIFVSIYLFTISLLSCEGNSRCFGIKLFVHKQNNYVAMAMEISQSAELRGSTSAFSKSQKKNYINFSPRMIQISGGLLCCCRFALPLQPKSRKKLQHTQSEIVHTHVANKESPMIRQFQTNFIDGWPFHGNPFALAARTFDERNARAFVICTRIWTHAVWPLRHLAVYVFGEFAWEPRQYHEWLQRRWSYGIFSGYSIIWFVVT